MDVLYTGAEGTYTEKNDESMQDKRENWAYKVTDDIEDVWKRSTQQQ